MQASEVARVVIALAVAVALAVLGAHPYVLRWERRDDAERLFEEAVSSADPDAAPEGAYWAGVTRYKRSGDAQELGATHKRLGDKFAGSTWAKKASVWAG